MLRNLSFILLISLAACTQAFAQDAPTKPQPPEAPNLLFTHPLGGSYLGVEVVEVSRENMSRFGLSEVLGVGVGKVMDNSPAARAGLAKNDVIVLFNGESVTSVRKLSRLIDEIAPDHTVKIIVLRNGAEKKLDATLAKQEIGRSFSKFYEFDVPTPAEMPEAMTFPDGEMPELSMVVPPEPGEPGVFFRTIGPSRQIGVAVAPMGKQLGEFFGAPDGDGLLINDVREDSPAARAGLRAGDVIVEVDGKKVNGRFDLSRAVNEKKEGDVTLIIIRDKNRQTVTVTPEAPKDGEFRFSGERGNLPGLEKNLNLMKLRVEAPQVRVAPFAVHPMGSRRIL